MYTNLVSECCHAPIVDGVRMEYPLGGSRFGFVGTIEVCIECEKETYPVEACGYCGEVREHECEGVNELEFHGHG